MRCPSTINTKTGKRSEIIFMGSENLDLADAMIATVPESELVITVNDSGLTSGMRWQQYFPHLTIKAQDFIITGKEEPGRHEAVWHTARRLAELGADRQQTRAALDYGNADCRPNPLSNDDLEHCLDTAYSHMV